MRSMFAPLISHFTEEMPSMLTTLNIVLTLSEEGKTFDLIYIVYNTNPQSFALKAQFSKQRQKNPAGKQLSASYKSFSAPLIMPINEYAAIYQGWFPRSPVGARSAALRLCPQRQQLSSCFLSGCLTVQIKPALLLRPPDFRPRPHFRVVKPSVHRRAATHWG